MTGAHARPDPTEVAGAELCRERLSVPARQLALEPRLQGLRQHRRPLLRGLEQAHGSAVAYLVNRMAEVGA